METSDNGRQVRRKDTLFRNQKSVAGQAKACQEQEGRPPCFRHENGYCLHPPFCVLHNKRQCTSGTNYCFVYLGKEARVRQKGIEHDRANTKNEATLWRKSLMRKNLRRQKEIGPFFLPSSPPPKSVHCSARDEKVAHFQEAHSSCNVIQKRICDERNPNSLEFKDLSAEWTEHEEDQARHRALKLLNQRHKIKGPFADVHKTMFFEIQPRTDQNFEVQEVHCRQWCFFAHDWRNSVSPQETKTIQQTKNDLQIQTVSGIVRSTNETTVCIQEVGTHSHAKVAEDSLSVLSLGRVCDELVYYHDQGLS